MSTTDWIQMALHNHVLINGYTLLPPTDEKQTIAWMQQLVDSIGMKTIQGPFASYVTKEGNRGLTAAVMIETSHIAMHVWDETDPAFMQFDLYTCSTLPVDDVIKNLEDHFGLFNASVLVLERSDGFKIIPEERWSELT
jgi:S-adenosylmethionine/arginine decarboxylase-like enzyme